MEQNLSGKIAFVTGASKGIGKAIAIELGKRGATVVVGYNSDENGANEAIEIIKENGGYGIALQGDISNNNDINNMVDYLEKNFGKLDILVNNAGVARVGLFMDFSLEDIDNLIGINLLAPMKLTNRLMDLLRNGKMPSVVNVSSIWGNVGASCEVVYSASKGGLNLFTKALAKEVAPWGIRVNGIAPGVINTEMNSWMSSEDKESLEQEIPMSRFGEVEEISKVVAFLCSDASSYVTGQIITIDGGMI